MKRDAESHAGEDKKRRELVDARNEADTVTYQMEKQLSDMGDKLSATDREPIDKQIERVREAAKGEDVEAIRTAIRELSTAAMAMGQSMYQKAGAEGAASADGGPQPGEEKPAEEEAIDVEFKEKK
jgi:molecular chaperone DnaK